MLLLLMLVAGWVGTSLASLGLRRLATNRDGRGWAYARLVGGILDVAGGPLVVAAIVWAGVRTPDLLAGVDPRGNVAERVLAWGSQRIGALGVRAVFLALGAFLLWDHWREWVQDGRFVREEWRRIGARDFAGATTRRQRALDRYGV